MSESETWQERLEAKLAIMVDTLEFYATAGPMELAQDCGFEMDSIDGLTVMVPGKRAREALAWKQVEKQTKGKTKMMLVWKTKALRTGICWHGLGDAFIEFCTMWRNGVPCIIYPKIMSYKKFESLKDFQGY